MNFLIFLGLLYWHCCDHMIITGPVKQPWQIRVNRPVINNNTTQESSDRLHNCWDVLYMHVELTHRCVEQEWSSCQLYRYDSKVGIMETRGFPLQSREMRVRTSKFTCIWIACSAVCSSCHQRKHQSYTSLATWMGNPPVIGGFPSQRASDAESVSISWRHHAVRFV